MEIECTKCGACCIGADISSLNKPAGVRCPHLTPDNLCALYGDPRRPEVCGRYKADEICLMIAHPDLDERVRRYMKLFDLF